MVSIHMPPEIRPQSCKFSFSIHVYSSKSYIPMPAHFNFHVQPNINQIDFNAVGLATGLKSPAARMRYTRLRRQIESGALNTGHGPGFSSASSPPPSSPNAQAQSTLEKPSTHAPRKRKRGKKSEDASGNGTAKLGGVDGPKGAEVVGKSIKEGQLPGNAMPRTEAGNKVQERKGEEQKESKIKIENHSGSDADFDSDTEDDEDSEDEIPLAKLRKRRAVGLSLSPKCSTALTHEYSQRPTPTLHAPMYSTYATSRSYGPELPGAEFQAGHDHLMERPPYIPQGFNSLAIGASNSRGDMYGRGLYASTYAGWIDRRGHKDQMGHPGSGWEYRAKFQEHQHQYHEQGQGIHSEHDIKDSVPRKSI